MFSPTKILKTFRYHHCNLNSLSDECWYTITGMLVYYHWDVGIYHCDLAAVEQCNVNINEVHDSHLQDVYAATRQILERGRELIYRLHKSQPLGILQTRKENIIIIKIFLWLCFETHHYKTGNALSPFCLS